MVIVNHSITHLSEFRQVGEREGGEREGERKGWGNAAEELNDREKE